MNTTDFFDTALMQAQEYSEAFAKTGDKDMVKAMDDMASLCLEGIAGGRSRDDMAPVIEQSAVVVKLSSQLSQDKFSTVSADINTKYSITPTTVKPLK